VHAACLAKGGGMCRSAPFIQRMPRHDVCWTNTMCAQLQREPLFGGSDTLRGIRSLGGDCMRHPSSATPARASGTVPLSPRPRVAISWLPVDAI